MKKSIINNKYVKLLLISITSVALGFILLYIAYSIKSERLLINIKDSTIVFEKEGTYPIINDILGLATLDNFTDAWMLLKTSYQPKTVTIKNILLAPNYEIDGLSKVDSLVEIYGNNVNSAITTTYGRYWHGYLVILKPLFCLLNYSQIRYINLFLQILIVTVSLIEQKRKNLNNLILPTFVLYFILMPISLFKSLQYSTIFYITYIQILFISSNIEKYRDNYDFWFYHFCFFGCATAYFDFLTYPLCSFAIPLMFLINSTNPNQKTQYRLLFICTLSFTLGYSIMWSSKWILATLFTNENIIENAFNQALARTTEQINTTVHLPLQIVSILYNLYRGFSQTVISSILFVVCLLTRSYTKKPCGLYIFIAFLPFLWWLVLANHSTLHSFFTFRIISVTVLALIFIIQTPLISSFHNTQPFNQ